MTLSQTAILTKQVITLSAIVLTFGLVSFIGYKIWHAYYLAHLPPVEEKPDTKFGVLPTLDFPKSTVSSSNFSYSIDTSTGNLPRVGVDSGFEKLIKVYFVTKTFATFLSAERSQNLAEKFDIKNPPQVLSETKYRFKNNDKLLTVDLDSGNFAFKKEATISGKESLEPDSKLVADFKSNLENLGVLKEDLQKGRTKVIHLKKDDIDIAQISLWPANIDNKPIFTPKFEASEIYGIVQRSADNLQNYLMLQFTYYPIDTSTFATYPLKSAEQAFEDLRNGKGIIAIEPPKANVSITSAYLAYYLGEFYNPYLQPIFVFEGPHFVAYTSAISEQSQTQANPVESRSGSTGAK